MPSEETTPEIVQCDLDDAAAARPALVVWCPAPGIIESLNAGGHSQAREADCEPATRARVTTSRRYCHACPRSWPQWLLLTGKPLLFIGPSTPDSAFQACIDQFEIKDGNRLRNSGSAANEQ